MPTRGKDVHRPIQALDVLSKAVDVELCLWSQVITLSATVSTLSTLPTGQAAETTRLEHRPLPPQKPSKPRLEGSSTHIIMLRRHGERATACYYSVVLPRMQGQIPSTRHSDPEAGFETVTYTALWRVVDALSVHIPICDSSTEELLSTLGDLISARPIN